MDIRNAVFDLLRILQSRFRALSSRRKAAVGVSLVLVGVLILEPSFLTDSGDGGPRHRQDNLRDEFAELEEILSTFEDTPEVASSDAERESAAPQTTAPPTVPSLVIPTETTDGLSAFSERYPLSVPDTEAAELTDRTVRSDRSSDSELPLTMELLTDATVPPISTSTSSTNAGSMRSVSLSEDRPETTTESPKTSADAAAPLPVIRSRSRPAGSETKASIRFSGTIYPNH
ncbi:MAG: hypothetical protein RIK87_04995 [Fuerstiella sp.]